MSDTPLTDSIFAKLTDEELLLINELYIEKERLHSIIKEVREYITSIKDEDIQYTIGWVKQDILQILDKENK